MSEMIFDKNAVFPCAVVGSDGVVVNIVLWDGVTDLGLDDELVEYTEENPAYIGGTYKDGVFLPPPEPEPEV